MKKNEKEKTSEKLTTPLSARSSYNAKKKTFIHIIPKESKNNLLNSPMKIPSLSEIIPILKKSKNERSFNDINKLNIFLTSKYDYFRKMRTKNDAYQYSRTLSVLKYTEAQKGKNIVTFDEEGNKCYVLLEGEISILKPQYIEKKMTMKQYVEYLKLCDLKDPSTKTRKRIIEKNNHILIDVTELLDISPENLDDEEIYNIFTENFEKVFEEKDGFTFGETSLLHKQNRNATIRAEKFCKLIYIDKNDYNKVMKESEKKRIDEEMQLFVDKFYIFNKWGYINMYKLYNLMTDIKLFKNDILYKQNEYNEYIYFCIDGVLEKYSHICLNWKKRFIDYISDFSTNFFLRVNTCKNINYLKLIKLISEARNTVPQSPMVFHEFNFGKFNLSCSQNNDINELIENKDEKFSDPYDLFKVSMNNVTKNDIIGLEEVVEFKRRFCTIKVKSDYAHLKRIKAFDFFKIFINNTTYERDEDYIINYLIEKKRSLVKQIELLSKYKRNKLINNYIEEYDKCYNSINAEKKNLNNKMEKYNKYINSLSNSKKKLNFGKNMFLKKKSKFQKFLGFNSLYNSKDKEGQKNNNMNDSLKFKSNPKLNFKFKYKLSPSQLCLYKRNLDNLENKFNFDSIKSKFSSLSPSTKNETIKLKDDSSIPNNYNKSFSSYKLSSSKSNKNFRYFNKNKNLCSSSYDKSSDENDTSKRQIKSKNNRIKDDNIKSFDLEEYKKNLYCKYGFLINEIIKLGIGPNIPLKKEMTILNNEINISKKFNVIDSLKKSHKKPISLEREIRKKRYEFLKITEL